ncbi:MAG TPA: hypothetical protein VIV12_13790 [Streptosporangiaceae bacterium]
MARTLQLVVAATAFLAAGCGGSAPHPQPGKPAATAAVTATATATTEPVTLTRAQACRRLLADIRRNGGRPDLPAIADVADHAADPRLAADARTVYRDLAHQNVSPLGLLLLQDDCAKAGVRLPLN